MSIPPICYCNKLADKICFELIINKVSIESIIDIYNQLLTYEPSEIYNL